jgi:hypothetical protein
MKILCFAPHSAIWVHAFPEALVVEALKQSGHEIVYVSCGGVFDRLCVPMAAHKLSVDSSSEAKKAICDKCIKYATIIRSEFSFSGCALIDLLTPSDRAWVKAMLEQTTVKNFLSLRDGGIELGRIALSHFLINHKKNNLDFSDTDWRRYQTDLENTLLSYAACRILFDREQPDRVLVYTPAYSVNFVCCEIARLRSIPHYYVAAAGNLSDRLQRLVLARGHAVDFQKNNIAHWPKFSDVPISQDDVEYTTEHVLELLRGTSPFVYSSPSRETAKDLRSHFGVRSDQKVLVATTSSHDEVFASQVCGLWPANARMAFATTIEWIEALVAYVARRPELFLIVRVHPREFPNKREAIKSEHALMLQRHLTALPDNVRVNWPTDRISLYDLACIADVGLNAWSSAGKELALFGIPVVCYAPDLLIYPENLNYYAVTPAGYFKQVERALRDGWSVEIARRAFRWFTLEYSRAMLDLSESVSFNETRRAPLIKRIIRRGLSAVTPEYSQFADCRKRAASLNQRHVINALITSGKVSVLDLTDPEKSSRGTLTEETEALRRAFFRIGGALANGRRHKADKGLLKRMATFAESGAPLEHRSA